jgi:hypothetical protein
MEAGQMLPLFSGLAHEDIGHLFERPALTSRPGKPLLQQDCWSIKGAVEVPYGQHATGDRHVQWHPP